VEQGKGKGMESTKRIKASKAWTKAGQCQGLELDIVYEKMVPNTLNKVIKRLQASSTLRARGEKTQDASPYGWFSIISG
jgi:hypothetical protein